MDIQASSEKRGDGPRFMLVNILADHELLTDQDLGWEGCREEGKRSGPNRIERLEAMCAPREPIATSYQGSNKPHPPSLPFPTLGVFGELWTNHGRGNPR